MDAFSLLYSFLQNLIYLLYNDKLQIVPKTGPPCASGKFSAFYANFCKQETIILF